MKYSGKSKDGKNVARLEIVNLVWPDPLYPTHLLLNPDRRKDFAISF